MRVRSRADENGGLPVPGDARVADAQAVLVAALASGEPSLPGFDATRLRALSELLRVKRRRGVAGSWPAVSRALGERFAPSFDEFAGCNPLRSSDAPMDDTLRFLEWLRDRDLLPRELRVLALKLRLRRVLRTVLARMPNIEHRYLGTSRQRY